MRHVVFGTGQVGHPLVVQLVAAGPRVADPDPRVVQRRVGGVDRAAERLHLLDALSGRAVEHREPVAEALAVDLQVLIGCTSANLPYLLW